MQTIKLILRVVAFLATMILVFATQGDHIYPIHIVCACILFAYIIIDHKRFAQE